MKPLALPVSLAALALAACSDRAQDHAERTGDAVASDIERASDNVAASVDSLGDRIADHVTNGVDGLAAQQIDRAADRISAASDRLEQEVRRHADTARDRTGTVVHDTGDNLKRSEVFSGDDAHQRNRDER